MTIKEYRYTKNFQKAANKFSPKIKKIIARKIDIFLTDPFSSELKTHRLEGRLKDFYSFSISYNLRIMFRFESDNVVEFIKIGTHGIYK